MEDNRCRITQDPNTAPAILSADHLLNLEERIEEAKLGFLLSLHKHEIDPHYAIHAMDAELHEELYDPGFDPCYPNARRQHEMVQATEAAVDLYMQQLEESDHEVYDVHEAEWNMLKAEGVYEVEAHQTNAIKQLYEATETCTEQLLDAVNKMKMFDSRPSLIGVMGRERTM